MGIGISLVSVAAVAIWISGQPAPDFPADAAERLALGQAIALYAVATLLRGERWLRMLDRAGARMSRADAYALNAIGYMGNNVLPARGGDAIRTYLGVQRSAIGYRAVIGTLIAERVLDAIFLMSLFGLLAFVLLPEIEIPAVETTWLLLLAAGTAVAAIVVVLLARWHQFGRRLLDLLRPLAEATRQLRGPYGAAMFAFTLAIWTIEAATYLTVGESVGLQMTPLEALYVLAVVGIFILIPSGPGYLGPLDAAVLFGVHAVGGSGSIAVSYLLMLRFVLMVPVTLAGLVLLIVRYGGFGLLRGIWRTGGSPA
jgi:glycosyltransferase 2 family protein